jgi:hypothetical protein
MPECLVPVFDGAIYSHRWKSVRIVLLGARQESLRFPAAKTVSIGERFA